MEKQRSSQGLRSFCLVILLWHCFSDDTLIILYTLYRIYMYLDAMEQIINTDAKPFLYSLLEATWCRWTDTISCYFLYIYIYITWYIIWLVSMFLMFLVGGCSVSMWYYNIDYMVISRTMSVVRYSCCCYRLMWRQPSRVCSSYIVLSSLSWMCSENPFFF